MDWLWHTVVGFVIGVVPFWAWVIIAGLLIGWAWKVFGWQGVAGAVVAVLTLGAYRQGWRDNSAGKPPVVPVEPIQRPVAPQPKPRRKIRTVWDIMNGR